MKKTLLITIIFFGAAAFVHGQQKPGMEGVLKTIQQLINTQNYRSFGLSSPEESKTFALETAVQVSFVPLDKLKALDTTKDIKSVYTASGITFYNVVNSSTGKTVSAVEIETKNGKAVIKSFGNTRLAQNLETIRLRYKLAPQNIQLVKIPALRLEFLESSAGGATLYYPLTNMDFLNIQEGQPLTNKALLQQVLPFASRYNGLPL